MINPEEFVQRYESVQDIFSVQCVNPELVDIYQKVGLVQAIEGDHCMVYVDNYTHTISNEDLVWLYRVEDLHLEKGRL